MSLAADLIGEQHFLRLTPADYASVAPTAASKRRMQLDTIMFEVERGVPTAQARISWGSKELEVRGPLEAADLQRLRQGTFFVDFYGKRSEYMKRLVVKLKPEALDTVLVWLDSKYESGSLKGLSMKKPIPASAVEYAMKKLGTKVARCGITKAALREGMKVELEHRDVTKGAIEKTARIAAAHICERRDYYKRLKKYVEK